VCSIGSFRLFILPLRAYCFRQSPESYASCGAQFINIMGKQIPLSTTFHLPVGRDFVLATGKLAAQADGSVLLRLGDPMLLCPLVSARKAN